MTAQSATGRPLWPILLSILLFCALLLCCWLLWQRQQSHNMLLAEQRQTLESLTARRLSMEEMLKLQPCEAKEKLAADVVVEEVAVAQAPPKGETAAASGAYGVNDVENACVFIVSANSQKKITTGTGFFVAPGYVVTNRHVVNDTVGKILVTNRGLGRPAIGRVVAKGADAGQDYAIIELDMPSGAITATLPLAADVRKTEKVGAWGFPDLVGKNDPAYRELLAGKNFAAKPELSFTEGVISAVLEREPKVIVHTAPISPGNSGGPLVNSSGEVVGINTMITLDEGSYRQASIALAASDLQRFLMDNGIKVIMSK